MTAVPLSFSPSVVLLVHEVGEEVQGHLATILELTGPLGPLAGAVELLQVDASAGAPEARAVALGSRAGPDASPAEALAGRLDAAVRRVRDWRVREEIEREGFAIANTVQVLVAVDRDDPWLGEVLVEAREALAGLGQAASVCALLDGPEPLPGAPAEDTPGPVRSGARADLYLLFTDRINFPAPAWVTDRRLRRYVLAQALFALVATGMPLERRFAQVVEAASAGSLRTCLVAFPREAVQRYCAASLGREVVEAWQRNLGSRQISPAEVADERAAADEMILEVRECLDDGPFRPATDPDSSTGDGKAPHRWPALTALYAPNTTRSDRAARAYQKLVRQTEHLFGLFAHADVDRELGDRPTRRWPDIAYDRSGRAPEASLAWQELARAAWTPLEGLLAERMRERVNRRWAGGERRLALLRRFVERCDEQLTNLVVAMIGLREQHEERFRRDLSVYQELADEWLRRLDEASLPDGEQVEPSGPEVDRRREGEPAVDRPPPRASREADRPPGSGHRLSRQETRIGRALRERVRTFHALVPAWSGLLSTMLLAFAGAGLPAALLVPPRPDGLPLEGLPLIGVTAAVVSIVLGVMVHLVVRTWRQDLARGAESDLLRFLCLCYAYRCERLEDRLRVTSLGPLRWSVQRMLRALEDVDGFFEEVRELVNEDAQQAESTLFGSPPGTLDLLVAEGRQLTRSDAAAASEANRITFDEVAGVVKRRWGAGGSPEALSDGLLASFNDATSLLEMEVGQLRDRLVGFIREQLPEDVMVGAPSDVYRALCDPAIRDRAVQQVESPLFVQRGTMQPFQRYVCGCPPAADGESLPMGQLVLGRQREWWLIGALFIDGAGS